MKTVETDHLFLRPIKQSDYDEQFNHKMYVSLDERNAHNDVNEAGEMFKFFNMNKKHAFVIESKKDRKLVGWVGLYTKEKSGKAPYVLLSFGIEEDYWDKAFIIAAITTVLGIGFEQLQSRCIYAYCNPDDIKSREALEEFGFKYDETLNRIEEASDVKYYVLMNPYTQTQN